jgi:hypothetical protein
MTRSALFQEIFELSTSKQGARSPCVKLGRINSQLLQDRSTQAGTYVAGDRRDPSTILEARMASLAFRLVDNDGRIGLASELAQSTDKFVLIRQGIAPLRNGYSLYRTFSYDCPGLIKTPVKTTVAEANQHHHRRRHESGRTAGAEAGIIACVSSSRAQGSSRLIPKPFSTAL